MAYPLSTLYLIVMALFFCGAGSFALARPRQFAGGMELNAASPGGLNALRGIYGGFFLLFGLSCALAAIGVFDRRAALVSAAILFGGVVIGRFVSLAMDRSFAGYGPTIRALFVIDIVCCAAALATLQLEP